MHDRPFEPVSMFLRCPRTWQLRPASIVIRRGVALSSGAQWRINGEKAENLGQHWWVIG